MTQMQHKAEDTHHMICRFKTLRPNHLNAHIFQTWDWNAGTSANEKILNDSMRIKKNEKEWKIHLLMIQQEEWWKLSNAFKYWSWAWASLKSKDVCCSVEGGAALPFPSNLIVSLLPSDLWHFQHSSHLLLSHLPGSSSPAALVGWRLQPQLSPLSLSFGKKGRRGHKLFCLS